MTIAVPEPTQYSPEVAGDLSRAAIEFFTNADDIDTVTEVLARMAALEEYVARRDPSRLAELQIANRRGEARIGELLGPAKMGRPTGESFSAVKLHPALRHEFRRMAAHLADWFPDHAGTSRAKVLKLLDRLERQADDRAARLIIDTDDDDTDETPRVAHGDQWTMYRGDADTILDQLPDNSVDLIITDPPYPRESLHLWGTLAQHADTILTDQGLMCALTGQIMLPDVLNEITANSDLAYGWTYCQPLPGSSSRIMARHIGQTWKPWLVFTKGPWPSGRIDWHPDTLDGAPMDKTRYQWQQTTGPAAQLLTMLGFDQALILDPFTGSGSYGIAALEMGMRFVGIEADAARFTRACQRLAET